MRPPKKLKTGSPTTYSISGNEFKERMREKRRKVENEQLQREDNKRRKTKRETKRKEREAEAAKKKKAAEEKKMQRERVQREKDIAKAKKHFKLFEQKMNDLGKKSKKKEDLFDSSAEEPIHQDESQGVEDITDKCVGCKKNTRHDVRVKCALCDKWSHALCVKTMDLSNKTQADIDVMRFDYFCCIDKIVGI